MVRGVQVASSQEDVPQVQFREIQVKQVDRAVSQLRVRTTLIRHWRVPTTGTETEIHARSEPSKSDRAAFVATSACCSNRWLCTATSVRRTLHAVCGGLPKA